MEQYPLFWNKAKPSQRHTQLARNPTATPCTPTNARATKKTKNTTSHQCELKLDKVKKVEYNSSYEWEMFCLCFYVFYLTEHFHCPMVLFTEEKMMATCLICGKDFPDARKQLGFDNCIPCNTLYAKAESIQKQSMVQPINKSTPTYIADFTLLKQLNPKRTI